MSSTSAATPFPPSLTCLQWVLYHEMYALQGLFLGVIGPVLSSLAVWSATSVTTFGPLLSAYGSGAMLASIGVDYYLSVFDRHFGRQFGALIMVGTVYFLFGLCLMSIPIVTKSYGAIVITCVFLLKGIVAAIGNFAMHHFLLSPPHLVDNRVQRQLQKQQARLEWTSNLSFGAGASIGPLLVYLIKSSNIQVEGVFIVLGSLSFVIMMQASYAASKLPSVHDGAAETGNDERVSLLFGAAPVAGGGGLTSLSQNQLNSSVVSLSPSSIESNSWILPIPVIGGVVLSLRPSSTAATNAAIPGESLTSSGQAYDHTSAIVVLLGTFLVTGVVGLQFGWTTFLLEYMKGCLDPPSVANSITPVHPSEGTLTLILSGMWLSMLFGYIGFKLLVQWTGRPALWLMIQCVIGAGSAILVLEKSHVSLSMSIVGLFGLGMVTSSSMTTCWNLFEITLDPKMVGRITSLWMFGAGCGEMFFPMLMGFFMGELSGAVVGSESVMYISATIAIGLVINVILLKLAIMKLAQERLQTQVS